jgi:hypothetical protein
MEKQPKPKPISNYDLFALETHVHKMINEALQPVHQQASNDAKRVVTTHLVIKDLQSRVNVLEKFANITHAPTVSWAQSSKQPIKKESSLK